MRIKGDGEMGKNIYLHEGNAEETLKEVVDLIKDKTSQESRTKAFEDCTQYWKESIEKVMNDGTPNGVKLSQIRTMFNIPFQDE